jgi:hypothetical protein
MSQTVSLESTSRIEQQLVVARVGSRVRGLRVYRRDGQLILEGECRSYHAKQLVTHAVREMAAPDTLVNDILVLGHSP